MKEYIYLIIPVVTLIICQIIKFVVESIESGSLEWARLFNGSGGMPSSHTSFSSSLTTYIGYTVGVASPMFAIALIFTMIISYDSMGVRLESGKQANAINLIAENFFKGKEKKAYKKLKEELGHEPLEVVMGVVLGFIVGTIAFLVF